LQVLEAARRAGGPHPHVIASSSFVYGSNPPLPESEDLHPMPTSPYAMSKLAARTPGGSGSSRTPRYPGPCRCGPSTGAPQRRCRPRRTPCRCTHQVQGVEITPASRKESRRSFSASAGASAGGLARCAVERQGTGSRMAALPDLIYHGSVWTAFWAVAMGPVLWVRTMMSLSMCPLKTLSRRI
jgi:hypothetical protein